MLQKKNSKRAVNFNPCTGCLLKLFPTVTHKTFLKLISIMETLNSWSILNIKFWTLQDLQKILDLSRDCLMEILYSFVNSPVIKTVFVILRSTKFLNSFCFTKVFLASVNDSSRVYSLHDLLGFQYSQTNRLNSLLLASHSKKWISQKIGKIKDYSYQKLQQRL